MKKLILFAVAAIVAMPLASFAQKTTVTRVNREKNYTTSTRSVDIWYEGELNIGYGMGGTLKEDGESADAKYARPFIETVHGVRITKYAFAGLGVGFNYAYNDEWKVGMMPVFLNLKGYYPVTETFAPYVSFDFGFSSGLIGTKDFGGEDGLDLKGGFYASYGVGLNYKRLNFGLGWQHQGMKFKYDGESSDSFSVNSFFVKIGLKF